MKLRDPRVWLAAVTAAIVSAIVLLNAQRAAPGPLTSSHAALAELREGVSCERCHGQFWQSMASACIECHDPIGAQLERGVGFHGTRAGRDMRDCRSCHAEHRGGEVALVGPLAFALAGVKDREQFEHSFTAYALEGAHERLECARCHRHADDRELAPGTQRFLGLSQRCSSCHEDPHGGRMACACGDCHGQSGTFEQLTSFEHDGEFPLEGGHAELACERCHAKGSPYEVEAEAGRGPLPGKRACASCHSTPHRPGFVCAVADSLGLEVGASCAHCHPLAACAFDDRSAANAAAWHAASGFDLAGAHTHVECASCHAAGAAVRGYEQRFPGRGRDDCVACHSDPHGAQFAAAGLASECAPCHGEEHFTPSTFDARRHAATALPLSGAHERLECSACHPIEGEAPRRWRGVSARCDACHRDPHDGAFATRLARGPAARVEAASDCDACHSTTSFGDVREFDHGQWTAFPLDGAHATAQCAACHPAAAAPDEFGRRFGRVTSTPPRPAAACSNCHEDVHGGRFPGRAVAGIDGADCASCHGVTSFTALAAPFDHGAWTGFPLFEAHADAECASCHGATNGVRASNAIAQRFPGPIGACSSCHRDPHAGAFPHVECSQCHSERSFSSVEPGRFDHARSTHFALQGAHASAPCEACHVPAQERDSAGRRFGRAPGRACAECHADPHAGQFARTGATDCARCHRDGDSFERTHFDHQRDSSFAHDRDHAQLSCEACHVPWPTVSGEWVVRYKPLGTACVDCHPLGSVGDGR